MRKEYDFSAGVKGKHHRAFVEGKKLGNGAEKGTDQVDAEIKHKRIGFLSGQLLVPDDYDRMLQAEIEEIFTQEGEGVCSLFCLFRFGVHTYLSDMCGKV